MELIFRRLAAGEMERPPTQRDQLTTTTSSSPMRWFARPCKTVWMLAAMALWFVFGSHSMTRPMASQRCFSNFST